MELPILVYQTKVERHIEVRLLVIPALIMALLGLRVVVLKSAPTLMLVLQLTLPNPVWSQILPPQV